MNLFDNILIKTLGVKKIVLCATVLVKIKERVFNMNTCANFTFQVIQPVLDGKKHRKHQNWIVSKK